MFLKQFVKNNQFIYFCLFFLLSAAALVAQDKGSLTGTVVDSELGDGMPGVNIVLVGTTMGAATDLDGSFRLNNIPAGTYDVAATFIGYTKVTIQDVAIKPDAVTNINFSMAMEALKGEEVVVTAKAIKNNETILLKDRQKAAAVSDAVSAEAMSRSGAGDAADAMKQVTGASVINGREIYVRGLGDRYTSTQLNGAQLPSTDPYKRSGSMDLIPANLVDNIVTIKSFTPDKPGDFSGGAVDINTKDFPDYLTLTFSASTAYNPNVHLNSNGPIGYQGSKTDWLGFDDGFRANPLPENAYIPDVGSAGKDWQAAQELDELTHSFNTIMVPKAITPSLDQKYAFSVGNQINLLGRPLGFLASVTYQNEYDSYDNGIYRRWTLSSVQAQSLTNEFDVADTKTTHDVLWGMLAKVSYKLHDNHKISFNALHNQNGVTSARYLEGAYSYDLSPDDLFMTSELAFEQRTVQNYQLDGEHVFPALFGSRLNWRASLGSSDMNDPDRRYFTSFRNSRGLYGIATNTPPYRFFRNMHEDRNEIALDYSLPFKQWNGQKSLFKMGAFVANAAREFSERQLEYNQNPSFRYDGDPETFFSENNIGLSDSTVLELNGNRYVRYNFDLVIRENFVDGSWYKGDQNIRAWYAMVDLPLTPKLRFIGGARYETTDLLLEHNAKSSQGQIDTQDWLPSANFLYQLGQNRNLRFAYGRTLARPSFREIAPYASWDFVGGDVYIGNPELKRTLIDNYDLRWEWFSRPGEIYAVSAFYKNFQNPIELVILQANHELMWNNVDQAVAYGLEFEVRKNLDVISSSLRKFKVGGNLSLVRSQVDITERQLQIIRETRPDADEKRPFQGQSPFLLNLTLSYDDPDNGISSSLYFNVFGERLAIVSLGGTPDVFEQPAYLLNFSSSYKLARHLALSFKVKNILDSTMKKTQLFSGQSYIYSAYNRGREFSLGLKYDL